MYCGDAAAPPATNGEGGAGLHWNALLFCSSAQSSNASYCNSNSLWRKPTCKHPACLACPAGNGWGEPLLYLYRNNDALKTAMSVPMSAVGTDGTVAIDSEGQLGAWMNNDDERQDCQLSSCWDMLGDSAWRSTIPELAAFPLHEIVGAAIAQVIDESSQRLGQIDESTVDDIATVKIARDAVADKESIMSTWGTTTQARILQDNMDAMQLSDQGMLLVASAIVSFSLADEIRDIKLCEITIAQRAGSQPWQPRPAEIGAMIVLGLAIGICSVIMNTTEEGILLRVFFYTDACVVLPGLIWHVDVRSGNSPWRAFLLFLSVGRQYGVVPLLAISVPMLVIIDGGAAKDIAFNTVAALFLLQVCRSSSRCSTRSSGSISHLARSLTMHFKLKCVHNTVWNST